MVGRPGLGGDDGTRDVFGQGTPDDGTDGTILSLGTLLSFAPRSSGMTAEIFVTVPPIGGARHQA